MCSLSCNKKDSDDFWHRKVKFWHFLTACLYSNSPNLVISFDYSRFLAKNLSYFVSLPWKLTGIAIPKIVQRYTVLFPGCLCHKCCPLNKKDRDIAIRYTTVMTRFRWSPESCEEIWNHQRGQLKKYIICIRYSSESLKKVPPKQKG